MNVFTTIFHTSLAMNSKNQGKQNFHYWVVNKLETTVY